MIEKLKESLFTNWVEIDNFCETYMRKGPYTDLEI
jgi:hypothetical protein